MIIEAILNLLVSLLLGVISLFPTIPTINTSSLDGVFQVLSLIDMFVSLSVLASCFAIIFVVMNARVFWSVIMWVVRKLPFLN